MSYSVKPPSAWGRIGTGFAKGLAEQVPKEIERNRLASGLEKFQKQSANQTPIQQLAQLSSIPGITPQMIQSFAELAKRQNMWQSFGNKQPAQGQSPTQQFASEAANVPFAGINPNTYRRQLNEQEINPQNEGENTLHPYEQTTGNEPQILDKNPLSPELQPYVPPTPEQYRDRLQEVGQRLNLSYDEAKSMVDKEIELEAAQPQAQREIQAARKEIRDEAHSEFQKQLENLLQKQGKEVFSDITGENKANLLNAMEQDLVENVTKGNKDLTIPKVAAKWAKKALELAKQKNEVKKISTRTWDEKIIPSKKAETLKKLMNAQKAYADTGNQEELFNLLRTKPQQEMRDEKGNVTQEAKLGYGLSPGGASLIAYPRSSQVKEIINNQKFFGVDPVSTAQSTMKFAQDVSKKITPNDSLLAIIRDAKDRNLNINEDAFLDYFRENQKRLGLSGHQRNELTIGKSDFLPNWGDISLFPAFGGSKANE
jgi:hypothetical protein